MVTCDTCPKPGRCCKGFALANPTINEAVDEAELQERLDAHISYMHEGLSRAVPEDIKAEFSTADIVEILERNGATAIKVGLPFLPIKNQGGKWLFTCRNLDANGRCTDYDNRPSICRMFKAGVDCAHVLNMPDIEVAESQINDDKTARQNSLSTSS